MGRHKFQQRASASDSPQPPTFERLVKEGLDLHDRADKRRGAHPEAACALFREAVDRYEAAENLLDEQSDSVELHFNMGTAYGALAGALRETGNRNSVAQADDALLAACERYGMVILREQGHSEALNNWGAALTSLAESWGGDEAGRLLELAVSKLEQAQVISPADVDAANNLADALSAWAQLVAPSEWAKAETLWRGAYAKFEQAYTLTEYPSDKVDCLSNWSHALSSHAELARQAGDLAGAASLYDGCAERIRAILQINTTDVDGYVACAEAIKNAGECRGGVCTPNVYENVGAALTAALQIDQNCVDALAGLGELCLDSGRELLARGAQEEGIQRLAEGWGWYQRLLAVKDGDANALYNAACVHALAGNTELALECLGRCRVAEERGGETDIQEWIQSTAQDADFTPLHAHPSFAAIMSPPQPPQQPV